MIRNLYVAAWQVFSTRDLIRENCAEQIIRIHSLELSWNFLAASPPRDRERAARIPAPPDLPHRRRKQCLNQQLPDRSGTQITKHFIEREAVSWAERQHDSVFGRRSLELEVKLPTEALSQRQ